MGIGARFGYERVELPADPAGVPADHAAEVDAAYRELVARLGEDSTAGIDDDGRLHVAALDAKPEPASLIDLRRRVEAMLPEVDLPELVMEVMSWYPEFIEAFTLISGERARVADLGLSVAAVLCGRAMNAGFKIRHHSQGAGVDAGSVLHVDQCYVRAERLTAANAVLVDAQAGIDRARAWGGGLVASIDGMRFVVPVRTHHARPNPKYFGRRSGVSRLNMPNDQSAGLGGAGCFRDTAGLAEHDRRVVLPAWWANTRSDHHRYRLVQRNRLRVAASAGLFV